MKYDSLKRSLARSAMLAAIAGGFAIPVMIYFYIMQDSLNGDYTRAKADIANLDTGTRETEARLQKAKNFLEQYEQIREDKLPEKGTESTDVSSRIRAARGPLQALKERYRLINLEMSLTTPVDLAGALKKEKVTVSDSKVTLKFSAATDELALSFIEALLDDFPGYVRIESLNISRNSGAEINDAVLSQIRAGNLPPLANVILVFDWMKLKENPAQQAKPAGTP